MRKRAFLVGVAALAVASGRDAGAHRVESARRWGFPAAGTDTLVVKNESGNIAYERWERDSIDVEASLRVKAPGASSARALHDAVVFRLEERGGTVALRADTPRARHVSFGIGGGDITAIRIRYRIRVPGRIVLRLSTVNGKIEDRSNR